MGISDLMKTRVIQNILLIEDDVWLARALEQVLLKSGFAVRVFKNGKHALESLARERTDLVITDIYMEDMDGMEVIRAVKKSFPKVKIIAISGGSRVIDLDWLPMARLLGADRAFEKPIEMEDLLKAIDDLDAELAPIPVSGN